MNPARGSVVILFDGVCNFCNGFANFILRRDRRGVFRLGTLQSPAGQALLKQASLPSDFLDSVVVIEGDHAYTKSAAALRIARDLPFPWYLANAFGVVPRIARDPIYTWIARNRYRWFGKRDTCRVPTKDEQSRFIT